MTDLQKKVIDRAVAKARANGRTEEQIRDLLRPIQDEAMAKHYKQGVPYGEVDAWYVARVLEVL